MPPTPRPGRSPAQVTATDADKDTLTYSGTTTAKGTVSVNAKTGAFTYTPTAAARHAASAATASTADKQDTVTLTVTDGHGGTTSKTVPVDIAPKNTAPTVNATVGKPNATTGVVTGTVTATDADKDALTYAAPTTTDKGAVSVNATTGAFTYTPTVAARRAASATNATAAAKQDTFNVTVSDGHGGTTTKPVTVSIAPDAHANTAPTGGSATGIATDTTTGVVTGTITGVSDPDSDALSYSAPTTSSGGGTVSVLSNGSFTYTPTAAQRHAASALGGTSTDAFTVTANDGHGGTTTVPVSVTISPANKAPAGGSATGLATDPTTGAVTGKITGVTDPEGDALSYSAPTTSSGGGTVGVDATTGAFTYTPTAAQRHAASVTGSTSTDTFTVNVNDGHGGTTAVPVSVTISPANKAPVNTGAIVGAPDNAGVVTGSVSATDPDGDTLSYSGPITTAKGSVTVNADGSFTYTPTIAARRNASASGATAADTSDSFTVTVSDEHGGTTTVPVTVAISPAPLPQPGDIRAQPGGAKRAIYAPNVAVGHDWLGIDPANGGIWLTDADVNTWLDVPLPTDTPTSGNGPYSPGDIKVPPTSGAGSITQYAIKTGPPLDSITPWFVCSTKNACFAVPDSYVAGWVDVKLPT